MKITLDKGMVLPDSDGKTREIAGWRLSQAVEVNVTKVRNRDRFKAVALDHLEGHGLDEKSAVKQMLPDFAFEVQRDGLGAAQLREHVEPNSPIALKARTPLPFPEGSRVIHRLAVDVDVAISYSRIFNQWFAFPVGDGPAEFISGRGNCAADAVADLLQIWDVMMRLGPDGCWPQVEEYHWVAAIAERIEVAA